MFKDMETSDIVEELVIGKEESDCLEIIRGLRALNSGS